ncbi:hypothetical protein [Photorhabdus hainanensis]|uniref:hypothetical protein n=1 Tax=Photorhabdus hainanensis TaxID=1004166 RepID=UPI001BD46994|nr:hypothetical protein [Photorhabdus hainanensis]MBS9434847.1 hypothetical protein [Photorhabdus hainanensis]
MTNLTANTVKQNPWRIWSILAYLYLFIGFWNVGLVAIIPALQRPNHGLLEEPVLQLFLLADILMVYIIVKSGCYNLKQLEPYYKLEKSGYFDWAKRGWRGSCREFQIGCDDTTGILCMCLISPYKNFDRHVSIIEFEHVLHFQFTLISSATYQVILTLDSVDVSQIVFTLPTKYEAAFFRTASAITHKTPEQLAAVRGDGYQAWRQETLNKGWLIVPGTEKFNTSIRPSLVSKC